MAETKPDPRLDWRRDPLIRPYVYARPENRADLPPRAPHAWFTAEPLMIDPLRQDAVSFAEAVLRLDAGAYAASGMGMPRWVFYDCAILPGLVTGFAIHRTRAPQALLAHLKPAADLAWLPLSMFIVIPAVAAGEWVAHNLASANGILPPAHARYGLGYLSKAFGLWFAGVQKLCGVAQWATPAVRLHAHFGDFEIVGSHTPLHSHPATLTYRTRVDPARWPAFFGAGPAAPDPHLVDAGFTVAPKNEESLKSFQRRLEERSARYYLNANQIRTQALDGALNVYKRTHNEGY